MQGDPPKHPVVAGRFQPGNLEQLDRLAKRYGVFEELELSEPDQNPPLGEDLTQEGAPSPTQEPESKPSEPDQNPPSGEDVTQPPATTEPGTPTQENPQCPSQDAPPADAVVIPENLHTLKHAQLVELAKALGIHPAPTKSSDLIEAIEARR